jgi:hypothetical protein
VLPAAESSQICGGEARVVDRGVGDRTAGTFRSQRAATREKRSGCFCATRGHCAREVARGCFGAVKVGGHSQVSASRTRSALASGTLTGRLTGTSRFSSYRTAAAITAVLAPCAIFHSRSANSRASPSSSWRLLPSGKSSTIMKRRVPCAKSGPKWAGRRTERRPRRAAATRPWFNLLRETGLDQRPPPLRHEGRRVRFRVAVRRAPAGSPRRTERRRSSSRRQIRGTSQASERRRANIAPTASARSARELKKVGQRWPRDSGTQRHFGDEQVAAFDRLLKGKASALSAIADSCDEKALGHVQTDIWIAGKVGADRLLAPEVFDPSKPAAAQRRLRLGELRLSSEPFSKQGSAARPRKL